jgi:hypothetical protein
LGFPFIQGMMAEKLGTSIGSLAVAKKEASGCRMTYSIVPMKRHISLAKKAKFAIKYNCHRMERSQLMHSSFA